jgi:hypothetical protein
MVGLVRPRVSSPLVAREMFAVEPELLGQLGVESIAAKPIVKAGKQFALFLGTRRWGLGHRQSMDWEGLQTGGRRQATGGRRLKPLGGPLYAR